MVKNLTEQVFFKRFPKIRKGEEGLNAMITKLQELQMEPKIRRLPCDVETRKQQKRMLTQYEMGKRLNTTTSKGCQTLSGFSTSVDPSIIPYRCEKCFENFFKINFNNI